MSRPKLSVIVPVLDEEDNVGPVAEQVRAALRGKWDWELIFVDDGSEDTTRTRVRQLSQADARIRLVALARRYGQSTAMQAGFDSARGEIIVSIDGDLQNDPRDIPRLVAKLDEGYDLVSGYRVQRRDHLITRKVPSWVANRLIRAITGVPIRDNGCSLKAYRRELLERMRLYSDLHRFIPAVAAGIAAAHIAEVQVRHHPRTAGTSKYGLTRVGSVLVDLVTVTMIRRFRMRPLRLFSMAALVPGLSALVLGAGGWIAGALAPHLIETGVSFLTVVVLLLALAAYLLMLGLLAEFVVRARRRGGRPTIPMVAEVSA